MARGITEDEVWKSCDALLLEGARPTIERVRQKLGRGSPNTVSPMLETWFKHLGARIRDPGAFAAPASMPDPIQHAALHLWEVAQSQARHDLEQRLQDGLAAATAQADTEKEKAAIAEAAAISTGAKLTQLQAAFESLQGSLDEQRLELRSTQALLSAAQQRQTELRAELADAHQAVALERSRADLERAAADERASGAERRAALEIERERMLRAKEEKASQAIARRFEAVLKEQVAAASQLQALEDRYRQYQAQATRREQELLTSLERLEVRGVELQGELDEAHRQLLKAAVPESLVEQIVAKLKPAVEHRGKAEGSGRARTRKRTSA